MQPTKAVINPIRSKRSPDPGPVVVLVSSTKDYRSLCNCLGRKPDNSSEFMMSRIQTFVDETVHFSVVGPVIGAPYAAILIENLIAWGAQSILYAGLCGSISPAVRIGDVILPRGSFIEEGTSVHYGMKAGDISYGSETMSAVLKGCFEKYDIPFQEGLVWTTDAVFRETEELIRTYQEKNAVAVEMELSALFTIGKYRGADIGAILVVSDELSTFQWNPGFGNKDFKATCKAVQRMIANLCLTSRLMK